MESLSWKHSVPTTMSWFQGQNPFTNKQCDFHLDNARIATKRKAPFFDENLPSKQYVSEEAMAAHLNQLHIGIGTSGQPFENNSSSANFHQSFNIGSDNDMSIPSTSNACNSTSMESEVEGGNYLLNNIDPAKSQLIISPEVINIQPEPMLPKSILDQIRKPSMELVLWKPPVGLVDSLIRSALSNDDENVMEKNSKDNFSKFKGKLKNFNSKDYDDKNSSMHKPFQFYRVVPAMTQSEIESLEEDMLMM